VLKRTYFSGFEEVIDIFAEAILNDRSLSDISAQKALATNRLQFEVVSKAIVIG
jgi:hypothetical protein